MTAKGLRRGFLAVVAVMVLVRSGNSCAFSDDDDMTVHRDPDKPYAAYVAGKLGIVSGDLRIRHMVIAYNTLSGRGLTAGEQKAAIDVDRFYNYGGGVGPEQSIEMWSNGEPKQSVAVAAWFQAVPQSASKTEHSVPGDDYETFTNCLDDAYAHAAATLADRRAKYGDSPEVKEWIAGQVAVFSNCSDPAADHTYVPPGQTRAPLPAASMPRELPASAPLWLRQDRAYQSAAAKFYAMDYDGALVGFRAIAADRSSPWAGLSRYVAARVLIRRALVPFRPNAGNADHANELAAAGVIDRLGEARDALQAIVKDPEMAQWRVPSEHLLDYVMVRLDPAGQSEELARRLTAPKAAGSANGPVDMRYRQNVIDLTFAYNSLPLYTQTGVRGPQQAGPARALMQPKAPLLRWINDLYGEITPDMGSTVDALYVRDPAAHRQDALAAWRAKHEAQWLAAAMIDAQPGGDGVAEMSAAAKAASVGEPVYATATYHRLRLAVAANAAASYAELAGLMPVLERTQPRSAVNAFADLESGVAPALAVFVQTATRVTPLSIQAEPGEGEAPLPAGASALSGTSVTLCGAPIADPGTRHLDAETAVIFNERMPLARLREAALMPGLPANVRFTVAHMAWTRAVLLENWETARAVSPYLAGCQAAMKPWLDDLNAAKTPEDRHVQGLLALMRFTSTDPTVSPWMERDFASYSEVRDNWWCDANVAYEGATEPPAKKAVFSQPVVSREAPPAGEPDPPFLTAEDRAAVERELAALGKVGNAGDYFARQALAWVKAHPTDARNPEVLGFAMRVVRNACRSNATKQLNHQLFDLIHAKYPRSEWAVRYTTWE